MSQNLVSLVYTETQLATAMAGIVQTEAALPGLVSLEPGEAKALTFMGAKTETFGRGTVRVLTQNPQIVPPSLDLVGAQADLAALDQLVPVLEAVARLHSRLEDTVAALGSDVMDVALDGYNQLKISGAAHGLEDLRRELGARWRSRRPAVVPTPAA